MPRHAAILSKPAASAICLLIAASFACNLGGQVLPTPRSAAPAATRTAQAGPVATPATGAATPAAGAGTPGVAITATPAASGSLTAKPASAISVALDWQPVSGANTYLLEASFPGGDFFQVASLAGDQVHYEHFVLPGLGAMRYRLSATSSGGSQPVGEASLTLPALVPHPRTVTLVAYGPKPINPIPTPDFNHLDKYDPSSFIKYPDVRAVISPTGGLISVTTPASVTFWLSLPAGAVNQPTLFTLTPIESSPDLPLSGGLLGALTIEPEIEFGASAVLTIALPAAPPGPLMAGFAATDEFFLQPVQAAGSTATLSVGRGGSYGVAAGTSQELLAQAGAFPTDAGDQLTQFLALQTTAQPPLSADAVAAVYDQALQRVISQLKQAPPQSGGHGNGLALRPVRSVEADQTWNAIEVANILWNTAPFLVLDQLRRGEGSPNLFDAVADQIKKFQDDTNSKCLTLDDMKLSQIIENMHGPGEFWSLLLIHFRRKYGEPEQKKSCTYELTLNSIMEQHAAEAEQLTMVVKTGDPLHLTLVSRRKEFYLQGSGQLDYTKYTGLFPQCPPAFEYPLPKAFLTFQKISPSFDSQDNIIGMDILSVTAIVPHSAITGSGTSDDSSGNCVLTVKVQGEPPDLWSVDFMGMHSGAVGHGNHFTFAAGADASTAAVGKLDVENYTTRDITENTHALLTIKKNQ